MEKVSGPERELRWYKSSRSAANGACVEVATLSSGVAVRDSKDPDGPVLVFERTAWTSFIAGVKLGELAE